MITTLFYSNEIHASPDTPAHVRIDIVNSGSTVASPQLDVIGLPEGWVAPIEPIPELPPNQSWRGEISFTIPVAASHGRHLAMVRLVDTATGETCGTNQITLTILPLEGVDVALAPGVVRGRVRAKTNIVVTNRSSKHVSLHLDGAAESLRLRCRPKHLDVAPGDIKTAKLRVRAKPRLIDANRYPLSVTARGSQLPIRATGSFDHRPMIGSVAKTTTAVVFLLALAVGGFLAALRLLAADDDAPASTDSIDITASDATDSADSSGTTTSSGSEDGTTATTDDNDASEMRLDQEGTVKLGGSDDDLNAGVTVRLRRISLDNPASRVSTDAGSARSSRKVFARGLQQAIALDTTDAPIELTTAENGRWTHTGLVAGLHYEISFRRTGYTTQSFVISPQRGVPLDPMEVELVPGDGALGGAVSGPDGPLGGAVVTVSDGQLTYTATTSTADGSMGNWSIEGIGTPSHYVVRVSSNGFGTEVISADLGPGEERTTLNTGLTVGVGSITGVVKAGGIGLGGAVITVSAGDTSITTTTLTQGVQGEFSLPRLPVGIEYTLEVKADGYLTQTQTVFVGSAIDDVEINLLNDSGGAKGTVTNDQGTSLDDVQVTIRSDTLSFKTTTGREGIWEVSGVPPGEYQVVFERFDHLTAFANITISAGASTPVPDPVLVFSEDATLEANATLKGLLIDNNGQRVVGAKIEIHGHDPAKDAETDENGSYEISGIKFGGYRISVTSTPDSETEKSSHQPVEVYQTFTLNSTVEFSPRMFTNGAFNGTVTQASDPGVAVPRATVTVSGENIVGSKVLTVVSGGFNEADFFPPGDYTLVAAAPGFLPVTEERTIPVGSPTPITVNFEMSLRPRLRVTVVAPTGTASDSTEFSPILDANVVLNPSATGTSGDLDKPVDNSTGIAEFAEEQNVDPDDLSTQLVPGTYTIDVDAPSYDAFTGHLETDVAAGETREVTIALTGTAGGGVRDAATGTITYLYDDLPLAIAGASVSADVIPGFAPATETSNVTPLPTVAVTTTTNENGVWVVDEHRFGSSTYTVSASNFATGTVDVDVSPGVNTNGDLTLIADPSTLSGRLELTTSDTTTSYTDFEATATGLSEIETVALEANGTYTIPITVQGTYDVTISRSDGNNTNFDGLPNNPIEVTTVPGGPTSVADITATELGTILVEVDPSNADVKLCTAVDQVCGDPVTPTAGTVQFTLPSAGNYFVQVSADGYETGTSPTREVGAGENVDLGQIVLQPWGTLDGTLSGRRGSPGANPTDSVLENITVTATPTGEGDSYTTTTGPDGSFSLSAPANTYNLSFGLTSYEASPLQPPSLEFATTPAKKKEVGDVIFQASAVTLDIKVTNDENTLIDADITLSHADETDLTGINHHAGSSPVTAGPLQPRTWTITVEQPGHNTFQTEIDIPAGGLGAPYSVTLPRNEGSIEGVINAQILGTTVIGPVGGVMVVHTPPEGYRTPTYVEAGSTVYSDNTGGADHGKYTVSSVVNGTSTLEFSKTNYETKNISVNVLDQNEPTDKDIYLVPANSAITLSVAENAAANFEELQAQLYLDTETGGTQAVGNAEIVGADRTVTFSDTPPSRTTSNVDRTHHYRIVLSGTGFVTETIDGLDLYPGTPLTENTAVVSHPSAPPTLSVVPRAEGGVTAGWTAPAHDGGDSVESYLVEWDLGAGTFINSMVVTGSFTADVATDAQGVEVSVRVSATNEAGTGPASVIETATAPSVPAAPSIDDATAGDGQVTLTWTEPANNGSVITSYEYRIGSGTAVSTGSTALTHTVPGLTNGTQYAFQIRARNDVGASEWSSPATNATPTE